MTVLRHVYPGGISGRSQRCNRHPPWHDTSSRTFMEAVGGARSAEGGVQDYGAVDAAGSPLRDCVLLPGSGAGGEVSPIGGSPGRGEGGMLAFGGVPSPERSGSMDDDLWEDARIVPVRPDETSRLVPPLRMRRGSSSESEDLLAHSRATLEEVENSYGGDPFLAREHRGENEHERLFQKSAYALGCSIIMVTSVIFVIVVSGITTLLANSHFPNLEVYSDWPDGGLIPLKYGCHAPGGHPISIPIHWRNVPPSATNLVVLLANPSRIGEDGRDPVHWFLSGIPLNTEAPNSIPANASLDRDTALPKGVVMYPNHYSETGEYWPPCSANGTSFFALHVYAIDADPVIAEYRDAREVMNRLVGVPMARITGSYGIPKHVQLINDAEPRDTPILA